MKKQKLNIKQNPNKEKIDERKEDIKKIGEKIFTLNLAIRGLVGHLPEFVVDKLVDICGQLSHETEMLGYYERDLKRMEEDNG